jgi:hypothetical protein
MKNSDPNDMLEDKEFNQMQLFHQRVHEIDKARSEKFREFDLVHAYLALRDYLATTEFKMKVEGIDFAEEKQTLLSIGKGLFSDFKDRKLWDENKHTYAEALAEIKSRIDMKINEAGILYPKRVHQKIEDVIEADF